MKPETLELIKKLESDENNKNMSRDDFLKIVERLDPHEIFEIIKQTDEEYILLPGLPPVPKEYAEYLINKIKKRSPVSTSALVLLGVLLILAIAKKVGKLNLISDLVEEIKIIFEKKIKKYTSDSKKDLIKYIEGSNDKSKRRRSGNRVRKVRNRHK